jgi:hypothetical protein
VHFRFEQPFELSPHDRHFQEDDDDELPQLRDGLHAQYTIATMIKMNNTMKIAMKNHDAASVGFVMIGQKTFYDLGLILWFGQGPFHVSAEMRF